MEVPRHSPKPGLRRWLTGQRREEHVSPERAPSPGLKRHLCQLWGATNLAFLPELGHSLPTPGVPLFCFQTLLSLNIQVSLRQNKNLSLWLQFNFLGHTEQKDFLHFS